MEFQDRLQKAVRRGQQRSERRDREAAEKALNEEELKGLHTQYRLDLSEHIEKCVRQLPNHFPGFKLETIFGESGWGAAVSRDDVAGAGWPEREDGDVGNQEIEQCIRRIRRRIERDPSAPELIVTRRSFGYIMP